MTRQAFVYFMTNARHNVLYIGVTNDLLRRVAEHKLGRQKGFTKRYHCTTLVYFEAGESVVAAIQREKQLKAGGAPGRTSWSSRSIHTGTTSHPRSA